MRGDRFAGVALALALTSGPMMVRAADCSNTFDSTFDAIQKVIFENRGCTGSSCHDAAASGGLDLTAGVSYDNLVDKEATTIAGNGVDKLIRVVPGQRDKSLLFINVAAKTDPAQYTAPLRPMPLGALPALSDNELDALRRWIEAGAPRTGTVANTADLLDACLPPQEPIPIEPLDPPAAGEGVQLHMPKWIVKKKSESEVCFASYYDVTDQVPEEFRGPNGTFRYKKQQIRQDPLSHHLIVNLYKGTSDPHAAVWGGFTCDGGSLDGQTCDPTAIGACGAGADCSNTPAKSIACTGAAGIPADAQIGVNSNGFTGTQETATTLENAPDVYSEAPLKGMLIWDSHAFNTTDEDGKLEAWLNFYFAAPDEQVYPSQQIFDTTEIFSMQVPAFTTREICNIHTMPVNAHLYELSSHNHKRGKRWRTFDGAWRCDGGPNAGKACEPYGPDPAFESPDLCLGAPCRSTQPPSGGDCNGDLKVTIDELVKSVGLALGTDGVGDCPRADVNEDNAITVDEIIKGVLSASQGGDRDPDESLLYTSLVYNDPFVTRYSPPKLMGGTYSVPEERSLTYCQLYDNGFTTADEVKKKSTSPPTPIGIPGVLGGPCVTPSGCTAGAVGSACSGATQTARNASCDSTDGAGDGICDACQLLGGVTTEDEMFILMGSFYVAK